MLLLQWLIVLRTPELAIIRVVMCSVVALVLGSLFWQSDAGTNDGLNQRTSYFAYGKQETFSEAPKCSVVLRCTAMLRSARVCVKMCCCVAFCFGHFLLFPTRICVANPVNGARFGYFGLSLFVVRILSPVPRLG